MWYLTGNGRVNKVDISATFLFPHCYLSVNPLSNESWKTINA